MLQMASIHLGIWYSNSKFSKAGLQNLVAHSELVQTCRAGGGEKKTNINLPEF